MSCTKVADDLAPGVSDTGIGMAPDALERLFEQFTHQVASCLADGADACVQKPIVIKPLFAAPDCAPPKIEKRNS